MNKPLILTPNSVMLVKYDLCLKEIDPIVNEWLFDHPDESRDTLSMLLTSKQVVLNRDALSRKPTPSPVEAIQLIEEIKQSNSLAIADKTYHFKEYNDCFIGSELVDWLEEHKGLITEEALLLGKRLFKLNLIQHTKNEHGFENEYLFYHFTLPKMQVRLSPREVENLLEEIQQSDTFEIKDRTFKLINYPQCFLGSDLIEWLIQNKKMTTIEAISLGKELIRNKYMKHVTNDHDFKDEALFYHFESTDILKKKEYA